ncbi:DUF6326 family protein [Desulfosporosinus sp.]|uniref:DUF6326 family protein n=1 Tax=Desulfosporosinus sp. TaxID=157907 RepID=UPI0025C3D9FA|nr:DUF6326 family protein [Desulfosporosinus sp.]MBC2727786.1 hypothetical protein [Desulfosporosinus sp.]
MNSNRKTARILEDVKINVKIKLAALWVALMFLYIYADIKTFFQPGIIEEIITGKVAGILITPTLLWATAILMSIPGVMVLLSLTLKPQANRWTNIIVSIFHIGLAITLMLMPGSWAYSYIYSIGQVVWLLLIVWSAWRWPSHEVSPNNK